MDPGQVAVWQARANTLYAQIDNLIDITVNNPPTNAPVTPRRAAAIDSLVQLLVCLRGFAENQFNYFRDEFMGVDPDPGELSEFPQENVMMSTIDQIGYDLWVITHAINQRFSPDPTIIATLEMADDLSWHALQPAAAFGLANTKVISYLHKSPSIRVIPYANTALIGIPHTAIGVPRDFLAIPHEIGHFVYWNGRLDGGAGEFIAYEIEDHAPQNTSWAYRWREEMFADLYGAFVAGPLLAFSFQDLHLQETQSSFHQDDRDHPPSVLRPNIYSRMVHRIGFPNWANLLARNWHGDSFVGGRRDQRSHRMPLGSSSPHNRPFNYEFRYGNNNSRLVRTSVSVDLNPDPPNPLLAVDEMFEYIYGRTIAPLAIAGNNWWRFGLADNGNNNNLGDLQGLYTAFADKINNYVVDPNVVAAREAVGILCSNYGVLSNRWEGRGQFLKGNVPGHGTDPDWLQVYLAGGWTTEAPHSNPPGP